VKIYKISYVLLFKAFGSFSDAKEELYKRGLKALFKMYKCFEGHKMKIKTPDCFVVLLQFQRGEQCHQHIINILILEN
jgi:hypothetical protein